MVFCKPVITRTTPSGQPGHRNNHLHFHNMILHPDKLAPLRFPNSPFASNNHPKFWFDRFQILRLDITTGEIVVLTSDNKQERFYYAPAWGP